MGKSSKQKVNGQAAAGYPQGQPASGADPYAPLRYGAGAGPASIGGGAGAPDPSGAAFQQAAQAQQAWAAQAAQAAYAAQVAQAAYAAQAAGGPPVVAGPVAAPAPSAQEPRKKKRRWLWVLLLLLLLIVAAALCFFLLDCNGGSKRSGVAGQLEGKSEAEIQAELDRVVEEGMFNISIASSVQMASGTAPAELRIENVPGNRYLMRVVIFEEATGEQLYETDLIEPNYHIQEDTLDVALSPGNHSCLALFYAYDPETEEEIGQAAARITIQVAG